MSFVVVERLGKAFGPTPVFADIDLSIARGEMCVLVGPSGCGKTTLLRAVAGLVSPDRGPDPDRRRGHDGDRRRKSAASAWCSSTMRCSRT